MGSSCSSGPKKDKASKKSKKSDKNGTQQEHRGSNASNSSVYAYQKAEGDEAAAEAEQVDIPPGTPQPTPIPKSHIERVDSASISSPMSPTQLVRQPSKEGDQDASAADIALLSEHVRDMVTGHNIDKNVMPAVPRLVRFLICFNTCIAERETTHFDQITKLLESEVRSELGHRMHILCLHPELGREVWEKALDANRHPNSLDLFLFVLSDVSAAPLLNLTPFPRHLPPPSAEQSSPFFSVVLKYYERDENASREQQTYVIRSAAVSSADETARKELWKNLQQCYSVEHLTGWDRIIKEISTNDLLMRHCVCLWNKTSEEQDETDAVLQQILTKGNIVKLKCSHGGGAQEEGEEEAELSRRLLPPIKAVINVLLDETQPAGPAVVSTIPLLGISWTLYHELVAQHRVARELTKCRSETSQDSAVLATIREYVQGRSPHPLVIHGAEGCGKTTTIGVAAASCSQWIPDSHLVFRFANRTPGSRTIDRLLGSVVQQSSFLLGEYRSKSLKAFDLPALLQCLSPFHPLVIMLDGLDSLCMSTTIAGPISPSSSSLPSPSSFDWVPTVLPENVRLVLTATDASPFLNHLKENLPSSPTNDDFIRIAPLQPDDCRHLLRVQLDLNQRTLTADQAQLVGETMTKCPNPLFIRRLSQCAAYWSSCTAPHARLKESIGCQTEALLETIEDVVRYQFQHLPCLAIASAYGYLCLSKHGLTVVELSELLRLQFPTFCLTVANFIHHLYQVLESSSLTMTTIAGNDVVTDWLSDSIRCAVKQRYQLDDLKLKDLRQQLRTYWESRKDNERRKLEELSFVCGVQTTQQFVYNWKWVFAKICNSSVEELLEDLNEVVATDDEIQLFADVLRASLAALSYDGRQFFSQMHARLVLRSSDDEGDDGTAYPHLQGLLDSIAKTPPIPCLLSPSSPGFLSSSMLPRSKSKESAPMEGGGERIYFTIHRIKDCPSHFVSLCPSKNEVTVWNAFEQRVVRRLGGVPQPRDIKFIDWHRAVILCNRELCIYDLNEGKFLVKLKGVMNQKMAYYDLHDDEHLVALSRNRMYVNMMNVNTGDCVATFKVGEDRFLNSLLVSANGGICVCGDETQKPFPLLVWDLARRKLLYDLRIPHHDFVTNLSAITNDGHYVVCVCQEVSDPTPNFIIVYDLQNGTLFKKWKPETSTCSVAISSEGGCVVNGLLDSNILVWDLITGACRFCLQGHTAAVTMIQLGNSGQRCLTADLPKGRDLAIRLWDLNKGVCLASFMPDERLTACNLSDDGNVVVLGLQKPRNINTLVLVDVNTSLDEAVPTVVTPYGDPKYDGLQVDLGS